MESCFEENQNLKCRFAHIYLVPQVVPEQILLHVQDTSHTSEDRKAVFKLELSFMLNFVIILHLMNALFSWLLL